MNACLWGESPKQYSFLCLIYVNHESFHKWNKRYCERLVWPGHARADSPTQSILPLTASAMTREHAHRHFLLIFFFLSTYISSNCQRVLWSNCSDAPWNIQPGKATPAARCHICWSPATSPWETRSKGVCVALGDLRGNKRQTTESQKLSELQ